MDKVVLFYDDRCEMIEIETIQVFRNLKFVKMKGKIYVNQRCLQRNQGMIFGEYRILWIKEDWHIIPIKHIFSFGRKLGLSTHVSVEHFRIENKQLIDLSSTNGTYVNGKRVKEKVLQDGDWIQVAEYSMYLFGSILMINTRVKNAIQRCESVPVENREVWTIQDEEYTFSQENISMSIQVPHCMPAPVKPKRIQIFGPSLSILLSGGLLSIGYYLFQSEQKYQIPTLLLTNISMFVAFLFYGALNYRSQWKQLQKDYVENDQNYLSYLTKMESKVQKARQDLKHQEEKYLQLCSCQKETYGIRHPLYVGNTLQSWITFDFPEPAYDQMNHHLYQCLQEKVDVYSQNMQRSVFLQKGQTIWIESNDSMIGSSLFAQWVWQHPCQDEKWIWVDPHMKGDERCFGFGYCQWQHQPLLVTSQEELLDFIMEMKCSHLWIFSTIPLQIQVEATVIFCTTQDITVSIDQKISNITSKKIDLRPIANGSPCSQSFWMSIKNASPQTDCCLRIPIGLSDQGKEIWIDLDEKKQGPHILVAGMTGSGKSEWISMLLMQLIIRNTPEQLQYILIDFKGGAFGQAFYQFAHCAGMVTNLEESAVQRWIESLRSEMRHRQCILRDLIKLHPHQIAHIDAYNQIHKKKMSHVLIVMDEFAQFKMRYPEAMNEIKEIARIGRSLGIHLVLATQKPMGIVDEQILSNFRLRICLKVNSESDSREVLHNAQAAHLKQAGAFVGFVDDFYMKGQGFWIHEQKADAYWIGYADGKMIGQSHDKKETTFQFLTNTLLAKPQNHHWIIQPDLKTQSLSDMMIDLPWKQQQIAWYPKPGEKILLYYEQEKQRDEWLLAMMTHLKNERICMVHLPTLESYSANEEISFFFIDAINHMDITEYMLNPIGMIICIHSYWMTLDAFQSQWDYILCLSWKNMDMVRSVFHTFQIPKADQGLIWIDDRLAQFYYVKSKPPIKIKKVKKQTSLKVGRTVRLQKDIDWQHQHPLLILYVQQSCFAYIQQLIQKWLLIDPLLQVSNDFNIEADIYVCDVFDCMPILTDASYIQKQYDFDLMWVGLGYREYSYLIHRISPEEAGDIYFWQDRYVWSFQYE